MGATMRVLVLDDDDRLSQLLCGLEGLGVQPLGATTRAEALACFASSLTGSRHPEAAGRSLSTPPDWGICTPKPWSEGGLEFVARLMRG